MKNRKNRTQRQEVRRILANMRTELHEYRLHYEALSDESRPILSVGELIKDAKHKTGRR